KHRATTRSPPRPGTRTSRLTRSRATPSPGAGGLLSQNRTVGANTTPTSHTSQRGAYGQVLGRLVPVSSTCHHASTPGLSTRSSPGSLTPPSPGGGRPHLEAGFPLRCLQRLSLPDVANQPCTWRHNWHTRGPSVPVLSY